MKELKEALNARYHEYQKQLAIENAKGNHSKAAELAYRSSEINLALLDILNIEYGPLCTEAK